MLHLSCSSAIITCSLKEYKNSKPQMGEQDQEYDINRNYFATLLHQTIIDLLAKGYIASSLYDGVEDGDVQMFSLIVKGARHVEELVAASVQQ